MPFAVNFTFEENSCKYVEEYYKYWLDIKDPMVGFRCFLLQMVKLFYKIEFAYFCASISLLLVIISIFGGIKEHYRWFILNQVASDLAISLVVSCDNGVSWTFYNDRRCDFKNSFNFLKLIQRIPSMAYPALLLLSFSRFLCLYFSNVYEKLTKGKRIFVTILIYNFVIIFTSLQAVSELVASSRSQYLIKQAGGIQVVGTELSPGVFSIKTTHPIFQNDGIYQTLKSIEKVQIASTNIKPFICLGLSVFATAMLIAKITRQFKFQMKNNKKDFYISLRITAVISFQTFLYCIFFFMEGAYDISAAAFWLGIRFDLSWYFGKWCTGEFGLCSESLRLSLIEIRILLESFIILFIMSGYREAVLKFIKFVAKKIGVCKQQNAVTPVTVLHSGGMDVQSTAAHHRRLQRDNRIAPQNQ